MMLFIKKNSIVLAGILTGMAAGYLYWKLVGCQTGSCAITSSPVNSTLYGALMGGLLFSIFKKSKNKKND